MNVYLLAVLGMTPLVLLVAAGIGHAAHRDHLARALALQKVLPQSTTRSVAIAVTVFEIAVGAIGLVAWTQAEIGLLQVSLVIATGLYASYAGYSLLQLKTAPSAPCGCSASDVPTNIWIVGRAVLLGGFALLTLLSLPPVLPPFTVAAASLATISIGALGATIWILPLAMSVPWPGSEVEPP